MKAAGIDPARSRRSSVTISTGSYLRVDGQKETNTQNFRTPRDLRAEGRDLRGGPAMCRGNRRKASATGSSDTARVGRTQQVDGDAGRHTGARFRHCGHTPGHTMSYLVGSGKNRCWCSAISPTFRCCSCEIRLAGGV
jgi:hypothetical protein